MPDQQRQKSGGAVFKNDRRTAENQPIMEGDIEITKDLLRTLVDEINATRPAKIKLTVFSRTSSKGLKYWSIKAESFREWEAERAAYKQKASQGPSTAPWEEGGGSQDPDDGIPPF